MILTSVRARLVAAAAAVLAVLASLLLAPSAGAAATVPSGATAAAAAYRFKAFKTPSGNIECGIVKASGRWSIRCDVYRHSWTAPPRKRPCEAGDYGSSVGMGGRARPRFICVSDAIGATRVLRYGKVLNYGPFSCLSRRKGLSCWNRLDRGWFLSRQRYSWNG